MKRDSPGVLFSLWLAGAPAFCDVSHAGVRHDPSERPASSASDAALGRPPDWSGAWSTFFGPLEAKQVLEKVLKPDALAEFNELFRQYTSAETESACAKEK